MTRKNTTDQGLTYCAYDHECSFGIEPFGFHVPAHESRYTRHIQQPLRFFQSIVGKLRAGSGRGFPTLASYSHSRQLGCNGHSYQRTHRPNATQYLF